VYSEEEVLLINTQHEENKFWSDLKSKLKNEGSELYEKIVQLKMTTPDGKKKETASYSQKITKCCCKAKFCFR